MAVLAETIAKNIAEGLTSFLGVFSGRLKVSDRCKVVVLKGGSIAQWFAYLLLDPAATGSIPRVPQKISEEKNCLVLLRLIDGVA